MLRRDDLARDLAETAHKLGVSRMDRVNLKKVIESLAVVDSRRAPSEQKGYARIFREYSPSGYTVLFKLAEKYWPDHVSAPPTPPVSRTYERAPLTLSWVLRFDPAVDPLVLASTATQRLLADCAGTKVTRFCHHQNYLELLVEQRAATHLVYRVLRGLSDEVFPRSAVDMEMPVLGSSTLTSWYADGKITCRALHRAAQASV